MNSAPPYHEPALLHELAHGSIEAFKAIYLHYYDPLVAQARQLTKDADAAADITQNIFLKLWDRRTQFTGYTAIGGWLFVASHHEALNYLKKMVRERKRDAAAHDLLHIADNEDMTAQEAQFSLIEAAVLALPEQAQRVFRMVRLEGKSYDDAAAALDISRNSVKTHLQRAGTLIREYVQQHSRDPLTLTTTILLSHLLGKW